MDFEVKAVMQGSQARAGILVTGHGEIETPVFMPVGTAGSVKGIHQRDLRNDIKAQIILGNTYHLYLRPGIGIIREAGGLHRLMGWDLPVLTDSGGFQVFSMGDIRKLSEEGARFQSHIDGSYHLFTPENVIDCQRAIGADIMMAFDECTPGDADSVYAEKSMELTHRWLGRCFKRYHETNAEFGHQQALIPVIQGGVFPVLRKKSAEYAISFSAEGYAIGGLSVGEDEKTMYEMVEICTDILPAGRPRYLMGVGNPVNILEAVDRGIDMFDCVIPTRNGRNGMLFTNKGIINIRNNKWAGDHSPVDEEGTSFVDRDYTRAYLRHLVVSGEMLGAQISSQHNLAFYIWLMKTARQKIISGEFTAWKSEMVSILPRRL